MPKPKKGARLGGSASHQKLILSNLAAQLFEHGQIRTTETKAKLLRPVAEKLITKAKRGTLADRRNAARVIRNRVVLTTLFDDIAPRVANRDGGYTRIIKLENRKGDNAPMALIQLVTEETVSTEASRATRAAASKKASEDAAKAAAVEADAATAEETTAEETTAEDAKTEDAKTEEITAEETTAEDAKTEETTAEDAKAEDTAAESDK